jgi:hypothetical protein
MVASATKLARQLHITPQLGRQGAELRLPIGWPQFEELL